MTTPGRAVIIVTRQRLVARSIKILGTEAVSSFFFSSSRISRSSVSSLPNSFLLAYHFERQSLLTATRRPIGFVFWPMKLFVGQGDFDVATALDDRPGGTARLRRETLEARRRTGNRFLDAQGLSGRSLLLFSALAMAECSVLATKRAPLRGTMASTACACKRGQALDLAHDFAHLLRGHRDISW